MEIWKVEVEEGKMRVQGRVWVNENVEMRLRCECVEMGCEMERGSSTFEFERVLHLSRPRRISSRLFGSVWTQWQPLPIFERISFGTMSTSVTFRSIKRA